MSKQQKQLRQALRREHLTNFVEIINCPSPVLESSDLELWKGKRNYQVQVSEKSKNHPGVQWSAQENLGLELVLYATTPPRQTLHY